MGSEPEREPEIMRTRYEIIYTYIPTDRTVSLSVRRAVKSVRLGELPASA